MFLIDLWLKKYSLCLDKHKNNSFLIFSIIFLFVIIVTPVNAVVFTQLGSDIVANAADDQLGTSVSISADGRRVVVGAPVNDGIGGRTGYVQVYEYSSGSWIKLGNDIDVETPYEYDQPGCTVSINSDGSRVAVGAYLTYGNGTGSGHVLIYEYNGSSWIQLGKEIYGEAPYDQSGTSVSLSADGSRIAIGAPYNDNNLSISSTGHTRIYEYNGSNWIQLGNDIDGEAHNDQSGTSVSISADGSRVAIGAPYNDGNSTDSGHVRIYEYNGSNWIQLGKDIDGEGSDDRSGASVSISADGHRVAVGAPYNYSTGYGSDHVRIYEYLESAESWIKLGSDINAEAANEGLGTSVSLSTDGSRVVVGAPGNDGGHVRIYEYNGSNWIKIGSDINAVSAYDGLGTSVSLSTEGRRVVIGAPYYSDGNRTNSGHARIYDLSYPCGNTVTTLTEYKWWSVSRPCGISTDPTIKELFSNPDGSGLGIYGDGDDWVMWKLDGTNPDGTEKYTMMDSGEVMKSGVGYWIITRTPGVTWNPGAIAETLDPTGEAWNVATEGTVGQTSLNGINAPDVKEFLVVDPIVDGGLTLIQDTQLALIGNPFPKKITWSNVYFSNNGTDYTAIDSIPFQTGVQPIAYVSDPDSTSGQPYKAVSSAPGFTHIIEQNQAFWIQMTGTVERHTLKRIALPLEY